MSTTSDLVHIALKGHDNRDVQDITMLCGAKSKQPETGFLKDHGWNPWESYAERPFEYPYCNKCTKAFHGQAPENKPVKSVPAAVREEILKVVRKEIRVLVREEIQAFFKEMADEK